MTLLQGDNAQGKTNLLEAISSWRPANRSMPSTSARWSTGWPATNPSPTAASPARCTTTDSPDRPLALEILLTPRENGDNFKKQIRVNGVNKRSMDLVGLMRAVLFLPEDIKLVSGSPGERRRYLDIALCQIDRDYCRTLSAYQKVLTQRNGLLKNCASRAQNPTQKAQPPS